MKQIELTKNKYALVDDEDFEPLSLYKWHTTPDGYAAKMGVTDGQRVVIRMHRELLDAPKGTYVDHINGDKLDNRKTNLRFATHQQNCHNTKVKKRNKLGLKGVCLHKLSGLYIARIKAHGKTHYLGYYKTPEEAYAVYCKRGPAFHGTFFNPG